MFLTRRNGIPNFKNLQVSHATDSGVLPEDLRKESEEIHKQVLEEKKRWKPVLRKRPLAKRQKAASYTIGPFNVPIDWFISCRWNELRTKLPLAMNEETWRKAWQFWRGANSYKKIKTNIEKFGMRQAILAEIFFNYNTMEGTVWHKCLAYLGSNPDWPLFITISGNERIMMAWFEWYWKTIPTMIVIRDCGYDPIFTEILRYFFRKKLRKLYNTKYIYRPVSERI